MAVRYNKYNNYISLAGSKIPKGGTLSAAKQMEERDSLLYCSDLLKYSQENEKVRD